MILVKDLSIDSHMGTIVRNFHLDVSQGELTLITGSSGSGKSLVLKVIAGIAQILNPNINVKGQVSVFGLHPYEAYVKELTFYIPQNLSLGIMFRTLRDELLFRDISLAKAYPVLKSLGLDNSLINRPFDTLSAGEMYKSLIALAILSKAKLILMDEPSTYLDPKSLRSILKYVSSIASNKGISVIIADSYEQPYNGLIDRKYYVGDKNIECEELVNEVSENINLRQKFINVLELADVWFRYGKREPWIIKNLTMSLEKGEIFTIVGPTGSGKTTLAKLIVGLLKPVKGLLKLSTSPFYIPQKPIYWFIHEKLIDVIKYMNLSSSILKYLGLRGKEYINPYMLSVGEVRTLSLIQAFLKAKGLVIIDEPTLGLDKMLRLCASKLINEASAKGISTLVLTNNMEFALQVRGKIVRLN